MTTQAKIKDIKKGEFIQLKAGGPVWVRGDYCRASGKYELQSFDDLNKRTYRKGDALVFIGFTF